ncbi:MAG TPA: toxin-antitoxin system YwqK family antitoxin [Planctomycetes bacterium]|nr:toxin-antitoxin system YwqK family antitoxin [Planctomycetota bacterium]HIK60930.1 toxin-antitoxin system YwqK family antitoxin [Planctomycetota bacterium]
MHLFPEHRRGPRGLYPSPSELANLPLWTVLACALGVLLLNFGLRSPTSELHAAALEGDVALAEGGEGFDPDRGEGATELGTPLRSPVRLDASSGSPGRDADGAPRAGAPGGGGAGESSQDARRALSEEDEGQDDSKVGLRAARGMVRDGQRVGMWEIFYDNGNRHAKGKYEDDLRDGRWEFWSESGGLSRSGEYRDGVQEGAWSEWHPNGSRRSEQTYRQGLLTSIHTLWYTNGQVKETGLYVGGLRQGPWQFYDFQGNPDKRTGTYLNGRRVTDGN